MGSLLYVRLRAFYRIIYLNVGKHPSIRRILFTLLLSLVLILHWSVLLFFKLLDKIFFPSIDQTKITKPVYIISTPRSGTTYLHALFSLDQENYVTPYLIHTIFPSCTFYFLINKIAFIDKKIGSPLVFLINKVNKLLFSGWENIHPMGFNHPEEDEALFTISLITPAVVLFSPFIIQDDLKMDLDHVDPPTKESMASFYYHSLQCFMHIYGKDKTLLIKNVFDCGRIEWLHALFPDARFVCPVRSPYQTIPSAISMFTAVWKVHSPEIPPINPYSQSFARLLMNQQLHYFQFLQKNPSHTFITIDYSQFIQDSYTSMEKLYEELNIPFHANFAAALQKTIDANKAFKSKHHYSLEEYGIEKEDVYRALEPLFKQFGFSNQ